MGSSRYQDFFPAGEQLLDIRRYGLPLLLHAGHGGLDASGVPQFERTQLPVEAEAHGAVDLDNRIGNLGNAVGRVVPEIGEHGPQKRCPLCLLSAGCPLGPAACASARLDPRCFSPCRGQGTLASGADDIRASSSRAPTALLPFRHRRARAHVLHSSCKSRPWFCRPATCAPASAYKSQAAD